MAARACLLIYLPVNYCYFPEAQQTRWQRETGGVQRRDAEHPQEKDKPLAASPTRPPAKYGLHCPNNDLQLNHARLSFSEEKKRSISATSRGAGEEGRGPGPAFRRCGTSHGALAPQQGRPCPPAALPVLLAASPRAGGALPRCSPRLSPSFCHPRPSASPRQAAAPPRSAADPARAPRSPAASCQRGGRSGGRGGLLACERGCAPGDAAATAAAGAGAWLRLARHLGGGGRGPGPRAGLCCLSGPGRAGGRPGCGHEQTWPSSAETRSFPPCVGRRAPALPQAEPWRGLPDLPAGCRAAPGLSGLSCLGLLSTAGRLMCRWVS